MLFALRVFNMKLSVVLTVYNEEENIKTCLESVKWADEIIVVDDSSTDDTVSIAKKYTSKIYPHKSAGYVEPSRNFAISKATGDWILLLDADETIPNDLAKKIKEVINSEGVDYVWIPRKNIIFGKWIQNQGWWPDYNVRLFKKGTVTWKDKIHSKPEINGEGIYIQPEEDLAILHQNYKSVSQFLKKLDKYTDVEAQEFIQDKKHFSKELLLSKPTEEFLTRMFAFKGYEDSYHGLLLSSLQAFSAQIVMAKVWEREGFPEGQYPAFIESLNKQSNTSINKWRYWLSTLKINIEKKPVKRIALRLNRRLIARKIKKSS